MTRRPHWLDVLLRHVEEAPVGPGVHHIEVLHDDDCAHCSDDPCDCDPSVVSGEAVDRKYDPDLEPQDERSNA